MKNELILVAIMMGAACPAAVSVGIPEPDVILYGHVCVSGSPASAEDDVTLIAKATVGGQIREVGRYKMGDNPAATDCNGSDDCYVLKIRLETVPNGEAPSRHAVVLDRANPTTVQIFLRQGQGPEQPATDVQIATAGTIQRLDLYDAVATADFNNDGRKDLADYLIFRASFLGPAVASASRCDPVDLNGDGYVDLRDLRILQAAFTGPAR